MAQVGWKRILPSRNAHRPRAPCAVGREAADRAREPSDHLSLLLKPSCAKDHFMLNFLVRILAIRVADQHQPSEKFNLNNKACQRLGEHYRPCVYSGEAPSAQRGLSSLLLDNVLKPLSAGADQASGLCRSCWSNGPRTKAINGYFWPLATL